MNHKDLLPRVVRKRVKYTLNELTARYQRLEPINKPSSGDVFVVGFPKSGNTWLQNIIVELVYGLDTRTLPDGILQDLVPDVHYRRHYKRYADKVYFKSHFFPQPEYRNVLYVLRDGRDAMVSYYHYLKANGLGFTSVDDFINERESVFPGKWENHVEAWHANPYSANIKFIKYEDLLDNSNRVIAELAQFLELYPTKERVSRVAENTSFKSMRSKEQSLGWEAGRYWPSGHEFVRKGKKQTYLEEMSTDAQRKFLEGAHRTLAKFGYSDSTPEFQQAENQRIKK